MGLVETRFESVPGDRVSACDDRWVGNWRFVSAADDDDAPDDAVFIAIGAECREVRVFEKGKQDDDLAVTLHFARVDDMAILAAQLIEKPDPTDKPSDEWDSGYHYFRYDARAQRIDLRAVDDQRIGHLLLDGKLHGRVEMISQHPGGRRQSHGRSQDNFVAGDAAAMGQVVRMRGVFQRRSSLSLIRVDAIPAPTAASDPSP